MKQFAKFIQKKIPFYYGWIIVAGSGSSMFVRNSAATLTIAVFVYPMSENLGWSRTVIVGASSLAGILAIFISPLSGWIIQKYGTKITLLISVLLLGLSTALLSQTFSPIMFYILFGISRIIFSSPIQIGATTVVTKWFSENRGKAIGLLGMIHSLGMGFFPLFAQIIMNISGGNPDSWRSSWLWIGVSVWIISIPLLLFTLFNSPSDLGIKTNVSKREEKVSEKLDRSYKSVSLKFALKSTPFWMLSIVGFLTYFIHTGINIHQAAYLIDKGISPIYAATTLTIMAIGTGFGSIICGWASDKFQAKKTYFFIALWLALSSFLFLGISNIFSAFVVAFIFGIALGGLLVIPPVVLADIFGKENIGAIRGYSEPFVSAGQAFGGITAGLIYDFSGSYELTFPIFTVVAIIAAILIIASPKIKD
jgi:MFS family permease